MDQTTIKMIVNNGHFIGYGLSHKKKGQKDGNDSPRLWPTGSPRGPSGNTRALSMIIPQRLRRIKIYEKIPIDTDDKDLMSTLGPPSQRL